MSSACPRRAKIGCLILLGLSDNTLYTQREKGERGVGCRQGGDALVGMRWEDRWFPGNLGNTGA